MQPQYMHLTLLTLCVTSILLSGCSQDESTATSTASSPTTGVAANPAPVTAPAIIAPAGNYALDSNHASMSFSVNHLGLSNYVARFTNYNVSLALDPDNLSASSVSVMIAADSITTDYPGDYKAGHKDSPYSSWDEDLALSPKFLNADQFPEISFQSTGVEAISPGELQVTGNLTLLGQTHPITLNAKVVGSYAAHPFSGVGALGFSASGTFRRSVFGMTHLLNPLLVGDEVTIRFEGEFKQIVPAEG